MKSFFVHEYVNLTLLIVLGFLRQASSTEESVSLYNANDKLTILNRDNFDSTVYRSKTA